LKIAIINTYDSIGGAAIATYRLQRGLRSIGVDSSLMVMLREKDDPSVVGPDPQCRLSRAISNLYARRDARITRIIQTKGNRYFSPARCPDDLATKVLALDPDLVHLSWVNSGFMKIETLSQFKKPIIWTLHDMWPFTGGCHYDDGCGRFHQSCGKCPILSSDIDRDLSRQIWERKNRSWSDVEIAVVTPSHWLANTARSSSLFKDRRIEVIPNGIDTERYKPLDKRAAREAFGLPHDKHLVLFSALGATNDQRKGNQFLIPALKSIASAGWGDKMELVIVGERTPETPPDLGMKVHYMGQLYDEISMALLYSAADACVAPSTQENLSNSVMEALSCGTPVVAFNIGGMPDMIDHQGNGYLATPFASDDLSTGIMWVLENKTRHEMLAQHSREKVVERFDLKTVANRYLALYQDILK
jgi:glycosyltransferase involved in cell wall biosynthesis